VARFIRRLRRLAAVLAGLVVLGLAVVHLPPIRSRVLDRGRAYAEREFGVALRASSLRYNLLKRSIEFRDLSVASASGGEPVLEADRLGVVLGPGLLLGRITVTRISLDRPRLTLVRNADGTVNLPASRNGERQQSPVRLGTVTVTALSVRLDDRLARRSFTVGPLDLSVDTTNPASRPGAFGPGTFSVRAGPVETSGTIAGRLAFDGARVRIEELTAETGEGRISFAGWADVIGERPAVSSRAAVTANLPGAARFMRVDARDMTGQVEATIDLSGPLAAPAVEVAVTSRDASCAPLGAIRLAGRSSFNGTRVEIEALGIDSAAGSVEVRGAIELGEPPASTPSRLALSWSNLRLDDLVLAFGRAMPLLSGTRANGSATVDFDARDLRARAWSRLRAAATTTFQRAADVSSPDSLGVSGRADLLVDHGRWALRPSIQAPRLGDVTGEVHGRLQDGAVGLRSTLGGTAHLRVANVGALPSVMRAAGVTVPPEATEGLAGSMLATVGLAGTIENPEARIDLAGRELRTRLSPQGGTLDSRLDVDASGIRVEHLQATAGATSLRASGRYSWRGDIDARADVNQQDLAEIAKQFNVPVTVGGSARLTGTFSGTGRRGKGVLALSAREVAIDQIHIGPIDADGTVTLEDAGVMTVTAAAPLVGGRAQLEVVNRAGYPVSGEVTLDQDDIAALIPAQYRTQVGDLSGKLSVTARGAGQLSAPAGIRGRIGVRALDVTALGTRMALAAPGSITLARDRVAVDSLDLRVGQHTHVTMSGQLGVTALPDPLRLHLEGPLTELIDIASRSARSAPAPVRSDGRATLDVTVAGTLGHPLPAGGLTLRSSSLEYGTLAPVTGLALDAAIDPTLITLRTLTAGWQGATLAADGDLPWRVLLDSMRSRGRDSRQSSVLAGWLNALPAEPARGKLTLRANDVTQAVLRDVVPPEQLEGVQGRAAATVAIEADALSLERIRATAVLDRASLTLAGVQFGQNLPTRLSLENGRARIDHFEWMAEGNPIRASGGMDVAAARPSVDLDVSGVLDLRVLAAFVRGAAAAGSADAALTLRGPVDDPVIVGRLEVADADLRLDSPRLAVSELEGTVRIDANRKVDVGLAGQLNTGTARVEGTLDLTALAAPTGTLQFTGRGIALDYPPGLQTESNLDLELALGRAESTVRGRIDVLSGTYREALVLSSQLLRRSPTDGIARAAPTADRTTRMRLDVAVSTADDVHVENNYGRLDIGAAFRVVGTVASPGVIGRLQAVEDGEIFFGGNTYRIERLTIDLSGARAITPEVNFSATTRVGNVPIGVELRCPAVGPCERQARSLVSGVDDKEAEALLLGTGGGAASAGEGLARLVSGELLGVVGRTVGLDAVRLEQEAERRDIFDDPTLISGDVDPAARLTVSKRLGSNVELIFSQNLADDGFTWITTYFGPYGLSGRALVHDDQSRAFEFRHEPPFGAARKHQRTQPGPRVAGLRITGTPGFLENEIRKHLRLADGDRFTFADWQRDRDRLERFYHARDYLEVRIRARRLPVDPVERPRPDDSGKPADGAVTLEYAIARGPATRLAIRGAELPEAVRDRIADRWTSAMFDAFLERDARAIVREHLYGKGYMHATVATNVALDSSGQIKTLTVDVVPGPVVPRRIEVTGNSALPTPQLLAVIPGDALSCWLDAPSVERLLENHYFSEGLLAADVSLSAPESRDGASVVTIRVVEGAPHSIGEIALSGLPAGLQPGASEALGLSTGDRYRPAAVAGGVDRLEAQLRQAAYRQSSVAADTRVDAKAGRVDITLRVTPGPRSILRDVVVQGADVRKAAVAEAIVLEPDAPLDLGAIVETRRRLYDLDVYRSVDIEVEPLSSTPSPAAPGAPVEQPVVARIALEERPRYRFRYGLAINDEEVGPDERDQRLGFAADLESRNVFDGGATTGLSLRLRRDQQVGRFTLGANRFFGLPIRSTLFVERVHELLDPEAAFPITSNITALSAEQAYRFQRRFEWRYGYGIERNHTLIRTEDIDAFDLTVTIARFTTSGLIDRRDDAFDPTRGWFVASTLELSTPGVGSDLRFLKDFTQHSWFVRLGNGLVLASNARLGLARTFADEVLVPSERFFAGGATSVRGYREDDLGERSIFGDAEGGSALLVLNGELRFPIYRWLRGVGFVDAGNVYPKVNDISFGDLQIGLGAGARFDTPLGLIRLDLGVPVNPRTFDPRWRFHLGFGHTF
jgi:outer membrane protein assembly factor BamA/autotransporter translocation and assembly factor TamB